MTVKGLQVLAYGLSGDIADITVQADNYDTAVSIVSKDIVLEDGMGAPIVRFTNFTHILSVTVVPNNNAYQLRLRSVDAQTVANADDIDALNKENKLLKAQLAASIQSNQMLEECIVEMAGGGHWRANRPRGGCGIYFYSERGEKKDGHVCCT